MFAPRPCGCGNPDCPYGCDLYHLIGLVKASTSSRRAGEGTVFALLAGESMYVDLSRMYDLPKKTGVLRLSLKGSSSAQ